MKFYVMILEVRMSGLIKEIDSIGSYRAGAALCCPELPHMEGSLCGGNNYIYDYEDWYSHYNERLYKAGNKKIPRPMMFGRKPCWTGDLLIYGSRIRKEDNVVACDFDLNHVIVQQSRLRPPTTEEYFKYFAEHIENLSYVIVQSKSKKSGVVSRIIKTKKKIGEGDDQRAILHKQI